MVNKLKLISIIFIISVICISLAMLRDHFPSLTVVHHIPYAETFLNGIKDTFNAVFVGGDLKAIVGLIFAPITGILAIIRYFRDQKTQMTTTFNQTTDQIQQHWSDATSMLNNQLDEVTNKKNELESILTSTQTELNALTQDFRNQTNLLTQLQEENKRLKEELAAINASL